MKSTLARLIKEPVLQFLVLGGGLFAAYAAFAPPEETPREDIVVTAARVESLSSNFERTWRRRPTEQELDGLIEDYLAEELLYREALKIGLDRDDLIVRRRMRQKMELLLVDALSVAPPDDDALRAFYAVEKDRYRTAGRVSFQQVFLGDNDDGQPSDWAGLADRINDGPQIDLASIAAPSLLPPTLEDASAREVSRTFGAEFATALETAPTGAWSGPIASAYGWHLVRVDQATPGEIPAFEDVRENVARDFDYQREREARADLVERLKQNYDISVERTAP